MARLGLQADPESVQTNWNSDVKMLIINTQSMRGEPREDDSNPLFQSFTLKHTGKSFQVTIQSLKE